MSEPKPWWQYLLEVLASVWTTQQLRQAGASPAAAAAAPTIMVDLPTFGGAVPQRPPTVHHPSPNYRRTPGRVISCVVLHATATPGLASPLAWLCDPASKVSAHYLIDRDGTVYQLVHEEDVAWHAGVSSWQGRDNVNAFSVGIELVNANTGFDPYSEPQQAACAQLVRAICAERGIAPYDVVRHADVAPGRKNDPLGLDMDEFRRRLA